MGKKLLPLPSILASVGVKTAYDWCSFGRQKILKLLADNEYGYIPPYPASMKIELFRERRDLVDGTARRREFRVTLSNNGKRHKFDVLVYSPEKLDSKPLTAIASLNFKGNAGVALEPDVLPLEAEHNAQPGRWPIKQLMEAGIMLVETVVILLARRHRIVAERLHPIGGGGPRPADCRDVGRERMARSHKDLKAAVVHRGADHMHILGEPRPRKN